LKWLKLYTEITRDPKVLLLSFEDRWHYVAVLCAKADGMLDQEPRLRDRMMRVHLGLDDHNVDAVRERLMDVLLIDEDWEPRGWDNRQSADATGAARKRRQRQREKLEDKNGDDLKDKKQEVRIKNKESIRQCDSHVTVTGQSRDVDVTSFPVLAKSQAASDYVKFAESMWLRIQPITRQKREPDLAAWADEIRKLIEIDEQPIDLAWSVFHWANTDDFWKPNILSAKTLRAQFPKLVAKQSSSKRMDAQSVADRTNKLIQEMGQLGEDIF
jgi:hypothetical protein